jgi:hypothetical protein
MTCQEVTRMVRRLGGAVLALALVAVACGGASILTAQEQFDSAQARSTGQVGASGYTAADVAEGTAHACNLAATADNTLIHMVTLAENLKVSDNAIVLRALLDVAYREVCPQYEEQWLLARNG